MVSLRGITNYLPTLPEFKLATPQQAVKNLTKIAVPVILLVGLTYTPKADAGFALMAVCMSTCLAASGGAFAAFCWAFCAGTAPLPTP